MTTVGTYKQYFDIDKEYFPTVNEGLIKQNPDLWLKYYPHDTFVKMVKNMIQVLEGASAQRAIWVEGAYGTGKSHAVLTLKKLLDASDDDTMRYFDNYKDLLESTLRDRLMQVKHAGRILTVHLYGSSNIHSDEQLVLKFQESIENALREKGLVNPRASFRDEVLRWLSTKANRNFMNELIEDKYRDDFGGEKIDAIIEHLKNYEGAALESLMYNLMDVGEKEGIRTFAVSVDSMLEWIKAVIESNHLKCIVFVWDEFTEYFNNNRQAITGFQRIAEFSVSEPFYLMIVTHKTESLFSEKDDKRKIFDRFVSPRSLIELPEHMAFKLLGAAMKKTNDDALKRDWNGIVEDLYRQTTTGRDLVMKQAKVEDGDLKDMLPLHPYTAIILKQISTAYRANQRSMFDFIKNDANYEFHGFKWFIDNVGPMSDDPLLTVDMLWDFFYEKGKQDLEQSIRSVLDYYNLKKPDDVLEQRILKSTLILQGIAQQTNNSDLYIPSLRNLESALEGCRKFRNGKIESVLNELCTKQILYKTKIGRTEVYNAMVSTFVDGDLAVKMHEIKAYPTDKFLPVDGSTAWDLLPTELQCRYGEDMHFVTAAKFKSIVDHLNAPKAEETNMIDMVTTWAKDDNESQDIRIEIQKYLRNNPNTAVVFVETCNAALGVDRLDQYADAKARAELLKKVDGNQSKHFEETAKKILDDWHESVKNGEYMIYAKEHPNGKRAQTKEQMHTALKSIIRNRYPNALELSFNTTGTLWGASSIKEGVKCGIERRLSGRYKASKGSAQCLDTQLDGVWNDLEYWTKPQSKETCATVASMKKALLEKVEHTFEVNGRISIREIYDIFDVAPFGLRPCNLAAFILGFILKEFVGDAYTWSDDTASDALTADKLAQMVDGIIKDKCHPDPKYRNQYIVRDREEIRKFGDALSTVFDIDRSACGSIENARAALREKLKKGLFPIWCLKANLSNEKIYSNINTLNELIDKLRLFASNDGLQGSDTTLATEIGTMFMASSAPFFDLKNLNKPQKLRAGMKAYVENYRDGALSRRANELDEKNDEYLDAIKHKFDAAEANWLWTEDIVQQRIDEVITEYEFMLKSEEFVGRTAKIHNAFDAWWNQIDGIKVPVDTIRHNYSDRLGELIDIFSDLYRNKKLEHQKTATMLAIMNEETQAIHAFFETSTQLEHFCQALCVCNYDLEQDEIQEFYEEADIKMWNEEASSWLSRMRDKIGSFIRDRKSQHLEQRWFELTEAKTPEAWSLRYQTPILAMVPNALRSQAERCFEAINRHLTDDDRIEEAERFINEATFIQDLSFVNKRDEAFRNAILADYSQILTNLAQIRCELIDIEPQPYKWDSSPAVRDCVKKIAEKQYKKQGYRDAYDVVDRMDDAELKRYLKELIRNNATVGIQIILSMKKD